MAQGSSGAGGLLRPRRGAVLAAVVLGCGAVALAGGIVALAFTAAEFASPDHFVPLSDGQAAASAVLAGAGVPAGIVALALGVNAVRWIRVRGLAGYWMAAAGLVSGAVAQAMYLVALGLNLVDALSYG